MLLLFACDSRDVFQFRGMVEKVEYMNEEGYALIGAAFEVHREIGGGLSEEIYQESLEWELGLRRIDFSSKSELRVFYKKHLLKKTYVPDLLVCSEVVAELKSVKALNNEHERQLLNYLRITKKAVGYLINFGPMNAVEWKRFMLWEYLPGSFSSEAGDH
jgi:GxxExxY protein